MTDTGARPVGDDGPDGWFDAPPEPRRRARSAVVLVLAAIPWVVVTAVLLRPDPGDVGAAAGTDARPAADAALRPTAPAGPVPDPAATTPPTAVAPANTGAVLATGTRGATTLVEAAAVGLVVGRAFTSGHGAPLAIDGVPAADLDGYVEHLTVEAVDHPGPDLAVVTLLAVVLRAADGRYATAHLRRLAVPVHVDGAGARPAGTPWWLPAPELAARPVELEAVADEDLLLAAAEAVAAAGYADVATLTVSTTGAWPLVADLTATAPGDDAPRTHRLWLRHHLGGLVVAGHRPPSPPPIVPPATPPAPTEEDAP